MSSVETRRMAVCRKNGAKCGVQRKPKLSQRITLHGAYRNTCSLSLSKKLDSAADHNFQKRASVAVNFEIGSENGHSCRKSRSEQVSQ